MGRRGPIRQVGSVRWKREEKKRRTLSLVGAPAVEVPAVRGPAPAIQPPVWLSEEIIPKFERLAADLVDAGVQLKQADSRAVAIAAGLERDLALAEAASSQEDTTPEVLLMAIRFRQQLRKDLFAVLVALGGTSFARLRAGIKDEPPKQQNAWEKLAADAV